jgi:hypothetical protein
MDTDVAVALQMLLDGEPLPLYLSAALEAAGYILSELNETEEKNHG